MGPRSGGTIYRSGVGEGHRLAPMARIMTIQKAFRGTDALHDCLKLRLQTKKASEPAARLLVTRKRYHLGSKASEGIFSTSP